MLSHFRNLNSPLKSVGHYPQLRDQKERFLGARYQTARARSLWQVWNDKSFVKEDLRLSVMSTEPFDEWEEFMLFAHHYALIEAWNGGTSGSSLQNGGLKDDPARLNLDDQMEAPDSEDNGSSFSCRPSKLPTRVSCRRFGASWELENGIVGHLGGLGKECRLNTADLYQLGHRPLRPRDAIPTLDTPCLCHTITSLGLGKALLAGGRTSPDAALAGCWILSENSWRKVDDLPRPLYRHSAVAVILSSSPGVLVFGGRHTEGAGSDRWYLWSASNGWVEPRTPDVRPDARFSSTMVALSDQQGLLFGGLRADCTICYDLWKWTLSEHSGYFFLGFEDLSSIGDFQKQREMICRVGACSVQRNTSIVIAGGTGSNVFAQQHEIIEVFLDFEGQKLLLWPLRRSQGVERMCLVGHSMLSTEQFLAIVGGGVTCFSFGSYWNQCSYILDLANDTELRKGGENRQEQILKVIPQHYMANDAGRSTDDIIAKISKVPRCRVETARQFDRKILESRPFVLEGLNLGACTDKWTLDILRTEVGEDRKVCSLHAACDSMAHVIR